MKAAIFALLIAGAFAVEFDSQLNDLWSSWKGQYLRVYEAEEEIYRRAIWEKTVAYITRHNLEENMGMHTYTLGLNQLSDRTQEEYKSLLGFRVPENYTEFAPIFMPPENTPNPATVDWRTKGYVTAIKNQGQCGSCWSFGATGGLEGQHFRKTGQLQSFSEQQLVDCSTAQGNHGCNGGLPSYAYNYVRAISSNSFLDIESCYTYHASQSTCKVNTAATCKGATATGFTSVGKTEAALATASASAGPISVGIDASHPSFQSYKSGIYTEARCSSTNLDHAVLVVGYGTDAADYWIVKNSWGTTWGQQGYIQMSRNHNNMCGIATMANYPNV